MAKSKSKQETVYDVTRVPNAPAVYAMYGGKGADQYVAYVGMADKLRQRLLQHLIRKDSSVTTGVSPVCLKPEFVTEVRWWTAPDFSSRDVLGAAELVAFATLDPVLRSRGLITNAARQLSERSDFRDRISTMFQGEPGGKLILLSFQDALRKLEELESRIATLERAALQKDIRT